MQRLEVSCAVRLIYTSLGAKELILGWNVATDFFRMETYILPITF